MQGSSRTRRSIPAILAALLGASAQAQACAFDGPLGLGLTAQHPRSIAVALAIRDAIDEDDGVPFGGTRDAHLKGFSGSHTLHLVDA